MANTLAYYDTATITAVKSFIVQAPVLQIAQITFESVLNFAFLFQSCKNFEHFAGTDTMGHQKTLVMSTADKNGNISI